MLTLLQRAGAGGGMGGGPPAGGPGDAVPVIIFFGVYFLAILIGLVIGIMFLLSLSKCLKAISEKNRQMSPGQVWLNLIPVFGTVWMIITILRISDSLKDEYEDRGLSHDGDYGKTLGIIYFASQFVCGCVTPILLIMYWLKIAGFTKELTESGGLRKKSKRRDDDDDDRRADD